MQDYLDRVKENVDFWINKLELVIYRKGASIIARIELISVSTYYDNISSFVVFQIYSRII